MVRFLSRFRVFRRNHAAVEAGRALPEAAPRELRLLTLWFWSLALLAVHHTLVIHWVGPRVGESMANFTYVLGRVLVFFAFALLLGRGSSLRRFQALSAVSLLVALEHLGFRLVLILQDFKANPGEYAQGLGGPLFGLLMSYIMGLPVVLLIALAGHTLGRKIQNRPAQARLTD